MQLKIIRVHFRPCRLRRRRPIKDADKDFFSTYLVRACMMAEKDHACRRLKSCDGRMRCAMVGCDARWKFPRASHPTIAQSIAHRILPSRIASYHRASHPTIAHRILPSRIASYHCMILAVYMHGPSRPS